MDRQKRDLREQKRQIKRAGNQRLRRLARRDLRENPEEAHEADPDYGHLRSAPLNGIDRVATRQEDGQEGGVA